MQEKKDMPPQLFLSRFLDSCLPAFLNSFPGRQAHGMCVAGEAHGTRLLFSQIGKLCSLPANHRIDPGKATNRAPSPVVFEPMNDLPKAGIRRSRRLRRPLAAVWLVVAAILVASLGTHLALRSQSESTGEGQQRAGRLDTELQLLAVPHQAATNRQSDGDVVTASATSDGVTVEANLDSTGGGDEPASSDPDDRRRRAITGKWHDEYHGKRHLTVRDDGTGTMVVEPDGIGKKLFAARLTFEIEWSVDDGRVTMKMLNGEPKSKVQLILKIYGQEADYTILELSEERMLLLDADGKTRYDWRRRESASE
jgi:hypothetical protein